MRSMFIAIRSGLIWGLATYGLLASLVIFTSAVWSPDVGIGIGIVGLLLALLASALAKGAGVFFAVLSAALLAIGGGLLAGKSLQHLTVATVGRFAEGISPANTAALDGATMFRFHGSRIARELAGLETGRTRRVGKGGTVSDSAISVAPVVDLGWTRDQPVRVWSVCKARFDGAACPGWSAQWRGVALLLPNSERADYLHTITKTVARYRLIQAPESLIVVRLVGDPPTALAELSDGVVQPSALFLAVWCIGFITFHSLAAWRRRRNATEVRNAGTPEDSVTQVAIEPRMKNPATPLPLIKDTATPLPRIEDVTIDWMMIGGRQLPFRWTLRQGRNVVCEVGRDHISFEISFNPSYPEVLDTYTFHNFFRAGSHQVREALGQDVLDQVCETIAAWEAAPPPHREVRDQQERMRASEQQKRQALSEAHRKINRRKKQ